MSDAERAMHPVAPRRVDGLRRVALVREPGRSSTLLALGAAAVLRRAGAVVADIVGRHQAGGPAVGSDSAAYDVVVALGAPDVAARLAVEWSVPLALVEPRAVDAGLAERLVATSWDRHPVVAVEGARKPGFVVLAETQVGAGPDGLRVTVDGGEPFGASTVVVRTGDPLGLVGHPAPEPVCRLAVAVGEEELAHLRGDVSEIVVESEGRLRARFDGGTVQECNPRLTLGVRPGALRVARVRPRTAG